MSRELVGRLQELEGLSRAAAEAASPADYREREAAFRPSPSDVQPVVERVRALRRTLSTPEA